MSGVPARPVLRPPPPAAPRLAPAAPGTIVKVVGLVSNAGLNGSFGVVQDVTPAGRVGVRINGTERPVSIRPENIVVPLPIPGWCHSCRSGSRVAFTATGALRCRMCGGDFVEGTVSREAFDEAALFNPRQPQPQGPSLQQHHVHMRVQAGGARPPPPHAHPHPSIPMPHALPHPPPPAPHHHHHQHHHQQQTIVFTFPRGAGGGMLPPGAVPNAGLERLLHDLFLQHQQEDTASPPATEEALRALRYTKATAAHTAESCTVCQDAYVEGDDLVEMPCGHMYHEDCLRPWLQRTDTCPSCRAPLEAAAGGADDAGKADGDAPGAGAGGARSV